MLNTGEVLKERYKVISVIGQGGMSIVYLVEDLVLENRWAMKETRDIFPDGDREEILDQFTREAKLLAGLSHKGLPRVIDYFTWGNNHYLVEEFINGVPSDQTGEGPGKLEEIRILNWALQICDILGFLHGNSIIYRDMKPGNILIDSADTVFLVDFGIARFFQGGKNRDTVIIGTPGFASPEHYGRGQTDARSDIFSLGATLHYLLTGSDPADRPFQFDIPYYINRKVSFQTSSIVMKCLDMDPARRFQKVDEVAEAIKTRAIPGLSMATRHLTPASLPDTPLEYHSGTDFIGRTAMFLSYTSIFPASMGLSGLITFVLSIMGPLPGFFAGAVSFPILCMEFWKRVEAVYQKQEMQIAVSREGILLSSRSISHKVRWNEILEMRLIKNTSFVAIRRIRQILIKTEKGAFTFDTSMEGYLQLIDIIIAGAGLFSIDDGPRQTVYVRA